nr:retrovirus-related Pol polyprotein from transposon TNT 1-94 [Tanacetum cinerariifolium]
MPPTPDLSFTGLDEFVNKPVGENYKAKSSEEEHKGNPQMDLQDQGVIDSGCSRHMTYLTDFEEIYGGYLTRLRCDNGTEFENKEMNQFCEMKGILRQFSVARTPQQNEVVERRNRTLIEAARTMLADSKLPTIFWAEAFNTACYVQNKVLLVNPHNKTSYILFHGRTPTLSIMRPFGCPVTILNAIDHLGKFDGKTDECFFVRYSLNSKTFRVFNSRTRIVEENLHIRFSESTPNVVGSGPDWLFDIDALTRTINYKPIVAGTQSNGFADPKSSHDDGFKPSSDDGKNLIVNATSTNEDNELPFDPNMHALEDVSTFNFLSDDKDDDPSWIEAMQEELLQFKLQEILTLVDLPNGKRAMGTKWVFRNKKDERGIMIRNKGRLVTQGNTQQKGIDYDKFFSLVARIEAIRLFLAYASFKDFVVYQMDVKSDFLYGKIKEEVYVCQPPGFKDLDFPDRVYKVKKALYGLHQASKAWYETLSTYLLENGYQRGKIDKTLFIKRHKGDILLVQVYLDDIIFGLQVKQKKDGIFISQDKYVAKILKKFGFTKVKTASTPIETQKPLLKDKNGEEVDVHMYSSMIGSVMYLTSSRNEIVFPVCVCARYQVNPKVSHLHAVKRIFKHLKGQRKLGLWYPKDSPFDLIAYTDSDYTGASLDRKSTTGDGKKITISEASIRRDLQLVDEEGVDCLPNSTIFEQLALMSTVAYAIICLATNQKFNFSKWIFDSMIRNLDNVSGKFLMYPRKHTRKVTRVPQSSDLIKHVADEAVHKELGDSLVRAATTASSLGAEQDSGNMAKTQSKATPNESSSQGTDSGSGPRCQETMGDTTAQTRFESVSKHSNDSLLTRGNTLRSDEDNIKLNELMELCATLQKRGRIEAIDADEDITLVNDLDDADKDMFDVNVLGGEEVFVAVGKNKNVVNITTEELTLAQALEVLKTSKPKVKGLVIQEPGESTTTTISSQQSQDKGKAIMIEEPVKRKKKDQIRLDEEAVKRLQAKFDKEERPAREKAVKEHEANIALIETYHDIQAKIDADHQLAKRFQAQEQEELSDAEKATLFQQLLEKGRKHFVAKREEEKRNKPPTQAQKRKIMCTYLKNMEGYKLKDSKLKEFDKIKDMFDRSFKRVNTFEDIRTELVK